MYDETAKAAYADEEPTRLGSTIQRSQRAYDGLAKAIDQMIERLSPLTQPEEETAQGFPRDVPSAVPNPRGHWVAALDNHIDNLNYQARRIETLMTRLDI